jgi:Flp pilus assembly protein CpaB
MIDAKRKAIILLTIAFLLAVAAAGVIVVQISNTQERLGKTVEVAAAAKDIYSNQEINIENDIKWVELPATSIYESLITKDEAKKVFENSITVVDLDEGELITDSLVRDRLNIPENERVVWLNATETVVLDQVVTEGDYVDIVVVFQDPAQQVQTKRVLTNIPVVEVDENNKKEDQEKAADEENSASIERVKVSLPITDAEMVIHHQNTAIQMRVLRVNQAATETAQK